MSDVNKEQQRVEKVIKEIDATAIRLQSFRKDITSDALELRETFWQDVTVNLDEPDDVIETFTSIKQQAELLSERERSHGQLNKRLQVLGRLRNSPYFGRIDFVEEGEKQAESVYLGIASLMDQKEEEFLIYDWRAPISSLYYDFPPGPASYETPEGEISGELTLKRQYIIRNGQIIGMFDTGITIGDEMLQEVLGSNANTQMKSIVATIQREQNQIIRNVNSDLLIVQGVAGSGKTSAALQRVAFLLYRYRGTLKSDHIMLFSPNPLFNSYVSTVLPELGEENMKQTTFQEYINSQLGQSFDIEDVFSQLEFLLQEKNHEQLLIRKESILYKGSLSFKSLIDEFVASFNTGGLYFKDIIFRKRVLISKMDILEQFYQLDATFSIPNRMVIVKDWILKKLRQEAKKEQKMSWVEEEIELLEKEDFLEAYQALKPRDADEHFDDYEQERKFLIKQVINREMKPIVRKVKNLQFIDLKKIYSQLFIERFNHQQYPSEWTNICKKTLKDLQKNKIMFEDATPFLYLKGLIEGRKESSGIRHVFVDEAQDYSPFQFALLKELYPYSKMTLLGDRNQAIFLHAQKLPTLFQLEDEEKVEKIVLKKSYRSTKQIVEFTRGLTFRGEDIEPFNRDGKKPTVSFANDESHLQRLIVSSIKQLHERGYNTIAVIGKTASETKLAFDALSAELDVHLMEKGSITYEKGIVCIPAYLAKGIEFDAVIMYNASQKNFGNEMEKELFYTACTRAMHELHLFSIGVESSFISSQPEETYEITSLS